MIITIIVLVILAAVTISAAFNSGIINTAVNGTINYATAQREEMVTFNELDESLQDIIQRINPTPAPTPEPTPDPTESWDLSKVTAQTSSDGKTVPVPKGFSISEIESEQSVENGLVIKDSVGNEFVWVPVDLEKNPMFTTYNGKDVGQLYDFDISEKRYSPIEYSTTGYREPDVVAENGLYDAVASNYTSAGITGITTADQFKEQLEREFGEMKKSVETYGGFYIGRYETGDLSKTTACVKAGNTDIGNQNWYKMYQMNKEIVNTAEGIKSSMIWGCQWDQVMIWFDSQGGDNKTYVYNSTGNYNGSRVPTGYYAVNNIYDMAGNELELTIEVNNTHSRGIRGRLLPICR